jgi:HK97 family phage major capsid protein
MGGSMTFPRQSGSSTAYWRGENTAITESEITLNDLTLRPKSVAALVKMSNEVLARSTPAIDGLIERDMKKQIGKAIDLAALRGSGTEYQPLGIANTTGINTLALAAAGAIFNFDNAIDMEALLEDDDALEGALGYIMHPRVKNLIRKLKVDSYASQTTNQGYHYPPIMSNAKLEEALGFGFKTTTQIPTNLAKGGSTALSEVYFGNWNELFIGQWGGMELKVSDETSDAFEKNQTWIRVIQEVDMGLRHVESFALVSDAATTDPVA